MHQSDSAYLSQAGFTPSSLDKAVLHARLFHEAFRGVHHCDDSGLHLLQTPEWATKYIRRNTSIPQAVLTKLGSNKFSKRRPSDPAPFLGYIQKRYDEKAFLHFRLVVGPVKNVLQCGAHQEPDSAEYLMFMQLARLMETLAAIYPYGIKVQMIPDDMRGRTANCWPISYSTRYISGLRRMAEELGFCHWLDVEEGQSRLYALYEVEKYVQAAKEALLPGADYDKNLADACVKARRNFVACTEAEYTESAVCDSARRYLVSHKAEILSGMWSPDDAFPLIYANHSNTYQLYTMAAGVTKLPWQVRLPMHFPTNPEPAKMMLFPADLRHEDGHVNA